MLKTKNFATNVADIPSSWVFEYYLKLSEKLTGQNVRLKSIFGTRDLNPSFYVYFSNSTGKYRFKDFSTGLEGDTVELVKSLFSLATRYDAGCKIVADYNEAKDKNASPLIIDPNSFNKYRVSAIKIRAWTERDKDYWLSYHISSQLLNTYNVKPLEYYVMKRTDSDDSFTIRATQIYGYFKKDGTLYKIYQPLVKERKFLKVKNYIQGSEQLTFTKPYLIIGSSLKDILVINTLNFKNAEVIAPDSESTRIPEKSMQLLKSKYKGVCTLFDNDAAGIKAMMDYQERYQIPFVHLKVEKDIADCSKIHGIKNTRELTYPLLTKALTGEIKYL